MGIVYSKPPTQSKVGYSRLIKAVNSWTLNGTKDRNFATSLGKLFHYLHAHSKNKFSIIQVEFPVFQLAPLASWSVTEHYREDTW